MNFDPVLPGNRFRRRVAGSPPGTGGPVTSESWLLGYVRALVVLLLLLVVLLLLPPRLLLAQ